MARYPISHVDTVVIGGGPSSLILSYILHGHIPYYSSRHHDDILHRKLKGLSNLLQVTPELCSHFQSSIRYSSQAIPLNTLFDTLIRPNADTQMNPTSCVRWDYEPDKAVSHVVLTDAPKAGGQWTQTHVAGGNGIGTLSYAELLSLPGYSFDDHCLSVHGKRHPDLHRPSREDVASYYATYPYAVGISGAIRTSTTVSTVSRTPSGFWIQPYNIQCKHLVLASGIFSFPLNPPPYLLPLRKYCNEHKPLLVIGSGFSAADAILSAPPHRKIIHIYRWNPETRPSPLRACHHQAYPDYAGIYRQMKAAALGARQNNKGVRPGVRRRKTSDFLLSRNWSQVYEAFPNGEIEDVDIDHYNNLASVGIHKENGEIVQREVGSLSYLVGRRGSLSYLHPDLRAEVLSKPGERPGKMDLETPVTSRTLREKAERNLEVAPDVFITGSLVGDSLVRHAFGSSVYAASKILGASEAL